MGRTTHFQSLVFPVLDLPHSSLSKNELTALTGGKMGNFVSVSDTHRAGVEPPHEKARTPACRHRGSLQQCPAPAGPLGPRLGGTAHQRSRLASEGGKEGGRGGGLRFKGLCPKDGPKKSVLTKSNFSARNVLTDPRGGGGGGSGGGGGGRGGTRPWWLALLACGGAYWPLAAEPSAMTSRHPHFCGHPHYRGHLPALGGGIQTATSAHGVLP